jgi:hypothetical protein
MPTYLVEAYAPDSPLAHAEASNRAARTTSPGLGVRHVETTFLPTDEVALHFFEAPSLTALEQAGRLAALPYERIVEAHDAGEAPSKEVEK